MSKFSKKVTYIKFPKFYPHQHRMYLSGKRLLRKKSGRGWFSIPTGGGKSFPMYKLITEAFKNGYRVQALLSPKIALNNQHLNLLEKLGMFRDGKILPIFFHTGKIKFEDSSIKFEQTTSPHKLHEILTLNKGKKFLIFSTYASDNTFLDEENGIDINIKYIEDIKKYVQIIHADEFHHFSQQTEANKRFIKNLPGIIFFYSASIFKGEIISVDDKDLFGDCLAKITIKQLQEQGIIVPHFNFRFYDLNNLKIKKIKSIVKDIAKQKGFDIENAYKEITAIISHFNYVYTKEGHCKELVYTKDKKFASLFINNFDKFREFLNSNDVYINGVFGETSGEERQLVFQNTKDSKNCIILNYSVILEGIDLECFNSVFFGRQMGIISLQQGSGRGSRTLREDKELFRKGILNITDPKLSQKMKKYTTYYGFAINNETKPIEDIKNIFKKLINIGIDFDTILKSIEEEKTKRKSIDDTDDFILGEIDIQSKAVESAINEIQIENFDLEYQKQYSKMSLEQLL